MGVIRIVTIAGFHISLTHNFCNAVLVVPMSNITCITQPRICLRVECAQGCSMSYWLLSNAIDSNLNLAACHHPSAELARSPEDQNTTKSLCETSAAG